MKPLIVNFFLLCSISFGFSQTKNVLFIGNSYTYENNLPQLIADLATSNGDTVNYDIYAPGGSTFYGHSLSPITTGKIMTGNWDYVVLQGQSLELWGNFPNITVSVPGAVTLDSLINIYNPCGETMFYRTWGRKNGFGSTSYATLDSFIHVNYMKLADSLNAVLSPVGDVWKYIRSSYPAIELYQADESHPSLAGSFAAACCFYSAIFRKNPESCFFNSNLPAAEAANIKTAAKLIVYDSLLNWHIGEYDSLFTACPNTYIAEEETGFFGAYPNPATSTVTVNVTQGAVEIYNASGDLIKQFQAVSKIINVEYLPAGLYLLRQNTNDHIFRFIKY